MEARPDFHSPNKRILVKISGEVLKGSHQSGFDPETLSSVSSVLKQLHDLGYEVCLVVGGGNFFRGRQNISHQVSRVGADHIGMLATVMNGIALQDALATIGLESVLVSNDPYGDLVQGFQFHRCDQYVRDGKALIFVGGLGAPYFTTDTCAVVRALEMKCDYLFKATKFPGIFDKDPSVHQDAQHFSSVTYQHILDNRLEAMDQTAFVLGMENQLKVIVFSLLPIENILKIVQNDSTVAYTLIS